MSRHRTNKEGILAVIGGSGFYNIDGLEDVEELSVDTPFGQPSEKILSARLGDTPLLFLARHGRGHSLLPSEINYRANIMAIKILGARWCLGISAVGSLKEELRPGDLVIPDQIIDRTKSRASTFFGEGVVAHVGFGDPYCNVLRSCVLDACKMAAEELQFKFSAGGTYLCMEGPAFSTRAESNLHRSFGADLIGMTASPEAKLAREAEIAYATLALVTDYDCWREDMADVSAHSVGTVVRENSHRAAAVVRYLAREISGKTPCEDASSALKHAIFCDLKLAPAATLEKLRPILERYL